MINPGTYRARAMGSAPPHVQFGMASTGTEQIAVNFMLLQEVFDGEDPTGEYEPTGEEITWVGSFHAKTQQRALESLGYAGWAGVDLGDLSGLGSTDVDLVIEHEEYEGKLRARVQWVNRAGGSRFKFKEEMPASTFVDLRKRMKALALALKSSAPRAAAPVQRPPQGRGQPPATRQNNVGRPPAKSTGWDGTGPNPEDDGRGDDLPDF